MTQEIRTFKDIQDAVIYKANLNDTTAVRNNVKQAINVYYHKISTSKNYAWSGVTKVFKLSQYYTTGTVTIDQDSDELTGTGTVWTENDHLFWKIKLSSDGYPYKIIAIDEANQTAILDTPYIGDDLSGASYQMFRDEYGLFPDVHSIRKLTIPGMVAQWQPTQCSPTDMDSLITRSPFRSGTPRKYTIDGFAHYRGKTWETFNIGQDYWEDSLDDEPKNKRLVVWPGILTQRKIAMIRYTFLPEAMKDDDDEPVIPYGNRWILVCGTLIDSFLTARNLQVKSQWEKEYLMEKTALAATIDSVTDELVLVVDCRNYRRNPIRVDIDEGIYKLE